jgi:lipoate-protein ligase A
MSIPSIDTPALAYLGETSDPAVNVAIDCALLERSRGPVARLWRNPLSVVLGFSQDPRRSVNLFYCWRNRIPIVRRPSGGGTVLHDLGNLNFSLMLPRELVGFDINTRRLYARLSEVPLDALRSLGIPADLSPINDIVVKGKKVSGLAMRVARSRLLFHGTILWKTPVEVVERALVAPVQRGFETHQRYIANLAALGFQVTLDDLLCAFRKALSGVIGGAPPLSPVDLATLALARAIAPQLVVDPILVDPSLARARTAPMRRPIRDVH